MGQTGNYKEYSHLGRMMTIESLFNLGMYHADTPLTEGFAKTLVNFDLKNQGTSLSPRGGIKTVASNIAGYTIADTRPYAIHHVGMSLVESQDGQDATLHKYVLVALITDGKYDFSSAHVFLDMDGTYWHDEFSYAYTAQAKRKLTEVHQIPLSSAPQCNQGVFVSIDANTYFPIDAGASNKFVRLYLKQTSVSGFSATLVDLTPKEIPASQVINSGYNMLKADPYTFQNTQNVTGALVLGGIIPKDAAGKIKLTADVGETVSFFLNYTYPASDVSKKYMVQWEVKDTSTSAVTTVIQQVRRSGQYTPGDAISLSYTIPYKQFTVIVKVYDAAVVNAYTYVSDEDDAKKLSPLQVITVSSYYITAGKAGNTANLTPRAYDLATCKDMCTWQQRTVLWGVDNAASTLFVSQPNLPEYVPYPNNVEVFSEDIVKCVPYLNNLLVFTRSKLYLLTLTSDGISSYYTTKCIQERLIMTEEDASTVQTVKNMVYFKSGNYFYMVVPNNNAGAGELQLAPVSRPIEYMLDNFSNAVRDIISTVYNVEYTFGLAEGADAYYNLTFVDYYNYLDGSVMRNAYKVKAEIYKANALVDTRYLDFVLNYDTVLRAWTSYIYESTGHRLVPYEETVTGSMTYARMMAASDVSAYSTLTTLKFDALSPQDEAQLTTAGKTRKFLNHQFIDTGYRDHFSAYKKRFREIQFSINNTSQTALHFYTSFTVDDDIRKSLFKYTTTHITDKNSPDYGLIYVERSLTDSIDVAGSFNLDTADGWTLDFAKFPTLTLAKVRYKVSGKGYNGKITILSKNEASYELLGTHWVYRKMNAR